MFTEGKEGTDYENPIKMRFMCLYLLGFNEARTVFSTCNLHFNLIYNLIRSYLTKRDMIMSLGMRISKEYVSCPLNKQSLFQI